MRRQVTLPRITFSSWTAFRHRGALSSIESVGVYLLAHFKKKPTGSARPTIAEIVYIGETTKKSLRKRLRQFYHSARTGKPAHFGGRTYHAKFGKKKMNHLYVAVFPVVSLDEHEDVRSLFIKFVERKLLLDFALRVNKKRPECNRS